MQLLNEVFTSLNSILKTISILDLIDIAIVTLIIYNGALLIHDSRAAKVVKGIAVFFVLYGAVAALGLKTMSFILNGMLQFVILAIIIVFQPELRRFLEGIGNKGLLNYVKVFQKSKKNSNDGKTVRTINAVVTSINAMSKNRVGALIVMERNMDLGDIERTGVKLDAVVQEELLGAIFYHNAPLHDGAVLIRENRIVAAGCFLPLSQNNSISKSLGTRHRASLGITESSDAIVIVVSEETGRLSICKNGVLETNVTREQVKARLIEEMLFEKEEEELQNNGATKHIAPDVDASYFNDNKHISVNRETPQEEAKGEDQFELTDEEIAQILEHDGIFLNYRDDEKEKKDETKE